MLRYKYPDVPRTYRVPGGMIGAWIVTLLPFAYAAIASYFILIPSASYVSKWRGSTNIRAYPVRPSGRDRPADHCVLRVGAA